MGIKSTDDIDYLIKILKALNNHPNASEVFRHVLIFINEVYKYIEPEFHQRRLVLFKTITQRTPPLEYSDENYLFDLVPLKNENRTDLIIQLNDNEPNLLWKNKSVDLIDLSKEAIVYEYSNKKERYYAGGETIPLVKRINAASNYSTYFCDLRDSLEEYKHSHIRHSSCSRFHEAWHDECRIFFKNGPESIMQQSLGEFLKNRLNFKGEIEVAREHNTDTSNPVDIRILWKKASRSALIEMKWLGKSINKDGKITQTYANNRAVEGASQLIEYLEKNKQSCPTDITKGFLVVIDGRRHSTTEKTRSICRKDGFFYENKKLEFDDSKVSYKSRIDFETPIRMFAEPKCSG